MGSRAGASTAFSERAIVVISCTATQGKRIKHGGAANRRRAEGFGVTHDGRPTSPAKRGGQRAGRLGRLCGLTVAAIMTASLAFTWSCGPASAQIVEGAPVRHITVTLNKSKTLQFSQPFSSAVIGAPDIADILPMTEKTLYVQGKKVGTTNISVFGADKHLIAVVDLEVALDAASLHGKIAASTGSGNINVSSANGEVVLSGEASDAVSAARAVDVAKGLSKDASGKEAAPVIDAMRVAASQQVMLKVRFLEVDRTAQRDLGVNWFGGNKNGIGFSGLGAVSNSATSNASVTGSQTLTSEVGASAAKPVAFLRLRIPSPRPSAAPSAAGSLPGAASTAQPFGALLAQVINTHGIQIDALISALEEKDLVKTLAEPNLISQSGQKAQFFAGTQIPIPTVQPGTTGSDADGDNNYYPCGVTLGFEPTVLNTGLINLHLTPQVCEVAQTTSPVIVNGTTIPELTTRSADTDVELRDGQSFAIAGLLQAQDVNQLSQLPWLGNVPVLGALFRSTNYQKQDTDLVVIVSVHLVRPAAPRHAPRDAVRHHAAGERHRPVPDGRRRTEEEIHRIRHQRRRPAGALRPHPGGQVMRARSAPDCRGARPRGRARRLQSRRLSHLLPGRVPVSAGLSEQLRRLCPGLYPRPPRLRRAAVRRPLRRLYPAQPDDLAEQPATLRPRTWRCRRRRPGRATRSNTNIPGNGARMVRAVHNFESGGEALAGFRHPAMPASTARQRAARRAGGAGAGRQPGEGPERRS